MSSVVTSARVGPGPRSSKRSGRVLRIRINGRDQEFEGPLTVLQLIEKLGWDPRKIAVERNLEIVPRSAHATTMVNDGDRLELVNFVGGG